MKFQAVIEDFEMSDEEELNTTDHWTITIKNQYTELTEVVRCNAVKVIKTICDEGPSIDAFVTVVESSRNVSKEVVSKWKEHKSKKFTETDHTFVKDYLEYTSNILSFCSDLTKFLRAAHDRHSEIEYMTSKMKSDMKSEHFNKILEDLENLKDSEAYDLSCKNLLIKLRHFEIQHENMITNLNKQMELQSEEKKTDGHGCWLNGLRRMIRMGCLFGSLVVSIADFIIAPERKKMHTIFKNGAMVVEEGADWVNSCLKTFKNRYKGFSTQTETLRKVDIIIIGELQDIGRLIDDMVVEIESVLVNVGYATDRGNVDLAMKNMPDKLHKFLLKIKESEGKLDKYVSDINEARDELTKSTIQFKNKGSCPIL